MTSTLIHIHGAKGVHPMVADLAASFLQMLGITADRHKLVQDVVRHAPEMVICDDMQPGDCPDGPVPGAHVSCPNLLQCTNAGH